MLTRPRQSCRGRRVVGEEGSGSRLAHVTREDARLGLAQMRHDERVEHADKPLLRTETEQAPAAFQILQPQEETVAANLRIATRSPAWGFI
jgi:hypothetical protein